MTGLVCQRCEMPLVGTQRKWCGENCRKRACDDAHRATCQRCGTTMSARTGFRHHQFPFEFCDPCRRERDRLGRQARLEDVAEMYREGLSFREIARQLGYGPNSMPPEVTEARRLGLIGYRNRGYEQQAA